MDEEERRLMGERRIRAARLGWGLPTPEVFQEVLEIILERNNPHFIILSNALGSIKELCGKIDGETKKGEELIKKIKLLREALHLLQASILLKLRTEELGNGKHLLETLIHQIHEVDELLGRKINWLEKLRGKRNWQGFWKGFLNFIR